MSKKKMAGRMAGIVCCVFVITLALTPFFREKRQEFPYDVTRKVRGFYEEPENSLDLIFIGSSNLFSSINPAVLWKEQGITSYVFGANEQNMSLSYYYLQEALEYQKPQAVVLDMFYCSYGEMQRDGVVRINLDDMRWGKNKVDAILHNVPREEQMSYFLPMIKYHDRWKDLQLSDLQIYQGRNPYKGWTPFEVSEKERKTYPYSESVSAAQLPDDAEEWMERIIESCEENGVELIFLATPNGNLSCIEDAEKGYLHVDGRAYYKAAEQLADGHGITFLNLNAFMEGVPHNDVLTSQKITSWFGEWYAEKHEVMDKRGSEAFWYWEEDSDQAYQYIEKALAKESIYE